MRQGKLLLLNNGKNVLKSNTVKNWFEDKTSPPYAQVAAMTIKQLQHTFETLMKHFQNTFETLVKENQNLFPK